eukprot:UN24391
MVHFHSQWQKDMNEIRDLGTSDYNKYHGDDPNFRKIPFKFSTKNLARKTHMWYGNPEFCRGMQYWEKKKREKGHSGCSTIEFYDNHCDEKFLEKQIHFDWFETPTTATKRWYPYFDDNEVLEIDLFSMQQVYHYGTDYGTCGKK